MNEKALQRKVADLEARLREAEETLEAIGNGAVDAIVVSGKTGDQVYTLQRADQSYRLLVESIQEGTVTISSDGSILYGNKQFADMLGQPLEKIIGSSFATFLAKDDRPLFEEALHNPARKVARLQVLLLSGAAKKIPVQITLGQADGDETMTAVITDLSEQLRYQDIVREEKLSRSIMDNSPDGIAVCDTNGIVIRASRALERFCQQGILLKSFDEVFCIQIPTENEKPKLFTVNDILAGGSKQDAEVQLFCFGGETKEVRLNAVPLLNDEQAIVGCLISIMDITKRKQAEEELRKSEERFRLALKNAPVSVALQDRNLVYQWAYNQQDRRSEEIIGKTDTDLFSPEDAARSLAEKRQVLASGKELRVQKWLTSNGRRMFLDIFYEPVRDADGAISGIGIAAVDLTEKQIAEERLLAGESKFSALFEHSMDGILLTVPDGTILAANPEACRLLGYTEEELLKLSRTAIVDDDNYPSMMHAMEERARTGMFKGELTYVRKDQTKFPAEITSTAYKNSAGETNSSIILRDISGRKQAEETLKNQSERLVAANKEMESFAYSVSHDLRAPLRAIDGFSRILLRKATDKLNDDEKLQFDVIRSNVKKMGRLIDDLLNFSRMGRQSMSVTNINMPALVEKVWAELVALNPDRRMSLKKGELPVACGDLALVRQVLVNLLSNAVKFTRKKEEALIEIGGEMKDAEAVYFVRDNGAGFDMNYYDKLFGVFQRLHSEAEFEGTGAGLAIVQRIILRHGGRVWAETEEGKGACFYFSLPAGKKECDGSYVS